MVRCALHSCSTYNSTVRTPSEVLQPPSSFREISPVGTMLRLADWVRRGLTTRAEVLELVDKTGEDSAVALERWVSVGIENQELFCIVPTLLDEGPYSGFRMGERIEILLSLMTMTKPTASKELKRIASLHAERSHDYLVRGKITGKFVLPLPGLGTTVEG